MGIHRPQHLSQLIFNPSETAAQINTVLTHRSSRLKFPRLNLVDVSRSDRPAKPSNPIYLHDIKYAGMLDPIPFDHELSLYVLGESAANKIQKIRDWIRTQHPVEDPLTVSPYQHALPTAPVPTINIEKFRPAGSPNTVPVGIVVSAL